MLEQPDRGQSQKLKRASGDRGHDRDFKRLWVKIKNSQQGRGYHVGDMGVNLHGVNASDNYPGACYH